MNKIRVTVAGPVSNDYETYQVKNHPDTVDLGVKLVMGAPFPQEFRERAKDLIEKIAVCLEPYAITLHTFNDSHLYASVSTLVRAPFDRAKYEREPEAMTAEQEKAIEERLEPGEVEAIVSATPPFVLDFDPWFIKIDRRGEILLLGTARSNNGTQPLAELRERITEKAPDAFREKGSDFHVCVGAIESFHTLDGLQKRAIRNAILKVVEKAACPPPLPIDRLKYVRYRNRSLNRLDSEPDSDTEILLSRAEAVRV